MSLKRSQIVGYNGDRMSLKFTMVHEARTVDCEVSSAALDDLSGKKGVRPSEREAQFNRLRDALERVASDIVDEDGVAEGNTIRIFSKHIRDR